MTTIGQLLIQDSGQSEQLHAQLEVINDVQTLVQDSTKVRISGRDLIRDHVSKDHHSKKAVLPYQLTKESG